MKKQLERIDREVTGFKGIIDMWDVINEVVIMPIFDKYDNAVTRICKDKSRVGLIKEVFEKAHECNPDAVLLLNDFNTSINYEILIDGCLNAGVPISAIGIQSHQHQGYWGKEKLEEVLERFSHFGLPIHFTENTLISGCGGFHEEDVSGSCGDVQHPLCAPAGGSDHYLGLQGRCLVEGSQRLCAAG